MAKLRVFPWLIILASTAVCFQGALAVQLPTDQLEIRGQKKAMVFIYPKKLTAQDKLSFGPGKDQIKTIPIKEETTLLFVDLQPGARFAHNTQCILISSGGTRIIEGNWWLVLNGERLFSDGKNFKVDFPIGLSGK